MAVLAELSVLHVLLVLIPRIPRELITVLRVNLVPIRITMHNLLVRNVLLDGFQRPECLLVLDVWQEPMLSMAPSVLLVLLESIPPNLVDLLV
jgi:hypothetical protein